MRRSKVWLRYIDVLACEADGETCGWSCKPSLSLLSAISLQVWSRRAGLTMILTPLHQVGFHTASHPPAARIGQKKTSPQQLNSWDGGWMRSWTPGAAVIALNYDILLLCIYTLHAITVDDAQWALC